VSKSCGFHEEYVEDCTYCHLENEPDWKSMFKDRQERVNGLEEAIESLREDKQVLMKRIELLGKADVELEEARAEVERLRMVATDATDWKEEDQIGLLTFGYEEGYQHGTQLAPTMGPKILLETWKAQQGEGEASTTTNNKETK